MVSAAWRSFNEEIARWRDGGRRADFWWRDDDATRPSPSLAQLLSLAAGAGVPLALAVVPHGADAALLPELGADVDVLQHGVDHSNRAAAGEKKTEFPAREPPGVALTRLETGRDRLDALFGSHFLAVLAPPWNRLPATLAGRLAAAGIHGLTTYGARTSGRPAPGVLQVNTHVDIIAWQDGRGFIGEDKALGLATRHLAARRTGMVDPKEPTGWLTHHAVHDEDAWRFLARLFEVTRAQDGIEWRRARQFFTDVESG